MLILSLAHEIFSLVTFPLNNKAMADTAKVCVNQLNVRSLCRTQWKAKMKIWIHFHQAIYSSAFLFPLFGISLWEQNVFSLAIFMELLYLYDGIMDVVAGKILYPKSLASNKADHQDLQNGTSSRSTEFLWKNSNLKQNVIWDTYDYYNFVANSDIKWSVDKIFMIHMLLWKYDYTNNYRECNKSWFLYNVC